MKRTGEDEQANRKLEQQYKLTRPNRHLQKTPTAAEYTFFFSACETFSKIDYMLHHHASLNKFKKTEVIQSISLSTENVDYSLST